MTNKQTNKQQRLNMLKNKLVEARKCFDLMQISRQQYIAYRDELLARIDAIGNIKEVPA